MAHRFRIALGLGLVALAGCAGTTHEVVPTGHDTYMVASHGTQGWSSGAAQKAKAFEEANAFCAKLGKEIQTISTNETQSAWGKAPSAEIEFRCVAPDDANKPPVPTH